MAVVRRNWLWICDHDCKKKVHRNNNYSEQQYKNKHLCWIICTISTFHWISECCVTPDWLTVCSADDCFLLSLQDLSALWGLWWGQLQLQERLVLPGHHQQHIPAGKDTLFTQVNPRHHDVQCVPRLKPGSDLLPRSSLPCTACCCCTELSKKSWLPSDLWASSSASNWWCLFPSGKDGRVSLLRITVNWTNETFEDWSQQKHVLLSSGRRFS